MNDRPMLLPMGKPTADAIKFSKNLSAILKERGVSVRAAAQIAKIPVSTLTAWTNGSTTPSLMQIEALRRLAHALGLSLEKLLTGNDSRIEKLSLTDAFDIASDPTMSGLFEISVRRITPKMKKTDE